MDNFEIEKYGYKKEQVDRYITDLVQDCEVKLHEQKARISDLKQELQSVNQQLETYRQKNDNISDALVVAVETAKQIENSSKNIYQLEIKRLRSLYDKWQSFLNDLMGKYPDLQAQYDTTKILKIFEDEINTILRQNQNLIEQKQMLQDVDTNTIGLKLLINKMSNISRTQPVAQKPKAEELYIANQNRITRNVRPTEKTMQEHQIMQAIAGEDLRLRKDNIKPISNIKMNKNEGFENLVDKFLSDDSTEYQNNAYSKVFMAKQKTDGFDLKEAVNPTENLEDIMKSFSFYTEDDK